MLHMCIRQKTFIQCRGKIIIIFLLVHVGYRYLQACIIVRCIYVHFPLHHFPLSLYTVCVELGARRIFFIRFWILDCFFCLLAPFELETHSHTRTHAESCYGNDVNALKLLLQLANNLLFLLLRLYSFSPKSPMRESGKEKSAHGSSVSICVWAV